jgi:hypothetical protein
MGCQRQSNDLSRLSIVMLVLAVALFVPFVAVGFKLAMCNKEAACTDPSFPYLDDTSDTDPICCTLSSSSSSLNRPRVCDTAHMGCADAAKLQIAFLTIGIGMSGLALLSWFVVPLIVCNCNWRCCRRTTAIQMIYIQPPAHIIHIQRYQHSRSQTEVESSSSSDDDQVVNIIPARYWV